jgi:uncharacterized MAPEG superfamily protein
MHTEILIAAWGAVLLFVHIFAAGQAKTRQYGARWNAGARDEVPAPMAPLTGRLVRAQANFQETFPIALVALFGVVLAGRTSAGTAMGGWIWLGARVVYLPLYALGVPIVRSLAFLASVVGLVMVLSPLLAGR